jgi:hypothetical protein
MLRAAAIALLAVPALAHADPPGMTPPVSAPAPSSGPSAPATYPPASGPYGQSSQFAAPPPTSYNPSFYPSPPAGAVAEQPVPPTGTPSYRGWTIGADVTAVTLFALAVDKEDYDLLTLSVGTYALGAPLVHAVHGRTGHAFASLGMRLGFPLLGAMLGEGLHTEPKCGGYYDDCYDEGPSDEAVIGALLGIGAAMIVDSAYLARGDQPRAQPQWSPTLRASQGGF